MCVWGGRVRVRVGMSNPLVCCVALVSDSCDTLFARALESDVKAV